MRTPPSTCQNLRTISGAEILTSRSGWSPMSQQVNGTRVQSAAAAGRPEDAANDLSTRRARELLESARTRDLFHH